MAASIGCIARAVSKLAGTELGVTAEAAWNVTITACIVSAGLSGESKFRKRRRNVQRRHHWKRVRRADRGDLRGAREFEAAGAGRARAGRAAFTDNPRGELSGLTRRHPGAGTDPEHAEAGGKIRRGVQSGGGDGSGFDEAAVQNSRGERSLRSEDADRGGGGFGAAAGAEEREGGDWTRGFTVRHVRRGFLPRETDRGGGGDSREGRAGHGRAAAQPADKGGERAGGGRSVRGDRARSQHSRVPRQAGHG